MGFLAALFAVFSFVTLVAGCADSKSKPKAPPQEVRTVIKGDPIEIIRGAQTNPVVPSAFLKKNPMLMLTGIVMFEEESPLEAGPATQTELEERNKTSGQETPKTTSQENKFTVEWNAAEDEFTFRNPHLSFRLAKDTEGRIVVKTHAEDVDAQLIHSSVSNDESTMSLLIYLMRRATQKKELHAFYFSTETQNGIQKTDKNFEYFFGTGVKIRWPKERPAGLKLCNSNSNLINRLSRASMDKWKKALDGTLKVEPMAVSASYPPFSDLNYRCLYAVDAYIAHTNSEVARYGVAYNIPNYEKSEFIDGDLFLFKKEFEKGDLMTSQKLFEHKLSYTLLHEIGHFFGLGHEFSGNKSIMSYDMTQTPQVSDHDIEALRELYR